MLYARVSLVDMNPETQLGTMREYCQRHDYEIVGEYTDRISGKSEDRPALRKALFKLKSDEADILMAAALDRLSRNVGHLIKLVAEIRENNRGALVLRENLDLTGGNPQSDLVLHLFAALAQFELSLIQSRTREALRIAKLSGKVLGRPSKLNAEIKERVLALHADGIAIREISRRIPEISRASIQKIIKAHNKS